MCSTHNNASIDQLDNTNVNELKLADLIAVSVRVMEFIKASQLKGNNDIAALDYRVHVPKFNATDWHIGCNQWSNTESIQKKLHKTFSE